VWSLCVRTTTRMPWLAGAGAGGRSRLRLKKLGYVHARALPSRL
jgi:hypothetical protein